MKLGVVSAAVLLLVAGLGRAQTAKEWKVDVAQYGLVKTGCIWYPGQVEFLDDDHLVISAPVAYSCDKSNWGKPADTRITVIDLQGHELAAIRRTDVVNLTAGPIGYVTVCTGDQVELLSRELQVATSISVSAKGLCTFGGGLSPSRTAIVIADPADSEFRLYRGSSSKPIAEVRTSRGQSVKAIVDEGFLVCGEESKRCDIVGPAGAGGSFALPGFGSYIVGFVAPDRLLVADFNGKRLFAETPTGEKIVVADIGKIRPPFIDSSDTQMSAVEPRRILYRVDGCLLGDFDDCYGVVFRRFAVFDSQTAELLFRHSYAPGARLIISPNGRVVMERDGAEVHLFRLP